jgi:TolB-like protein
VGRLLAKSPADRYGSPEKLIDALDRPDLWAKAKPEPRVWRRARMAVVAVALVVSGVLATQWFAGRGGGTESLASIESLIVLPPSNPSADPDQESLMAGLHDALITELNKLQGLAVISQWTTETYTGTAKSLSQIADEVDVDGVAETAVFRQGDSLFIQVRLFQGTPERLLWSGTFGGLPADRVTLPRQVAANLAEALSIGMTTREQELLSEARPVDPEAWDLYRRGLYLLDQGTHEGTVAAEALAREAIAEDPTFAEAHALLASALNQISYWTDAPPLDLIIESEAAASRALELDSTLAVAGAQVAGNLGSYRWQWDAAETEFRRVLELNPGSVEAHMMFGVFLVELGRSAEAISHTAEAVRLDPVNLMARNVHAMALVMDHRYEEAAAAARELLKLDANFPVGYG